MGGFLFFFGHLSGIFGTIQQVESLFFFSTYKPVYIGNNVCMLINENKMEEEAILCSAPMGHYSPRKVVTQALDPLTQRGFKHTCRGEGDRCTLLLGCLPHPQPHQCGQTIKLEPNQVRIPTSPSCSEPCPVPSPSFHHLPAATAFPAVPCSSQAMTGLRSIGTVTVVAV